MRAEEGAAGVQVSSTCLFAFVKLDKFWEWHSFSYFSLSLSSLCVVGLIVIALAAILGRLRDDWKLKKPEREPRPGDY
jgi:hypothetical protein